MRVPYPYRFTLFCAVFFPFSLAAQRAVPGLRPEQATIDSAAAANARLPLDTPVPVTYVLLSNPTIAYTHTDSLDWADIRHVPLDYTDEHLGNFGSATRSFRPEDRQVIGAQPGWWQYEPYYLRQQDFRFYNQDIPVAQIAHSQASQEDTYLTIDFGRSFARGLSLSAAYRRINQVGEFSHQRQKTTGLGIGVWHNASHGRYDAFYHFLANGIVSQENGGIREPGLIGTPNYPNEVIPVYLTSGITEHKHRSLLTRQIFHLTRGTDGPGIDVFAQARLGSALYKFVDESAGLAADYYGDLFFTDSRGIRQFTYVNEQEIEGGILVPATRWRSSLQGSLRYRHLRADREIFVRDIHELYLEGQGVFNSWKALRLMGDLSLGLGQAQGNFRLKADGELMIGPLGKLTGHWHILSRKPYFVETSLYVDERPVYEVTLRNPFLQDVGIGWVWEKQKLTAGLQWILLDNYIYFDSLRLPQQVGAAISLQRLTVEKAIDFDWMGIRAAVLWQPGPDRRLAVPDILAKGSLYGRLRLFRRKVDLMPGFDAAFHGGLRGQTYFPVNGVYHLTSGADSPTYLRIDAGIMMKINFLQVSVRMEDIVGLFKDRVLYEADFYPHYPGYFRLGLSASFFN